MRAWYTRTSAIRDSNGLDNASFSYQWLQDDNAMSVAISPTYVIIGADGARLVHR